MLCTTSMSEYDAAMALVRWSDAVPLDFSKPAHRVLSAATVLFNQCGRGYEPRITHGAGLTGTWVKATIDSPHVQYCGYGLMDFVRADAVSPETLDASLSLVAQRLLLAAVRHAAAKMRIARVDGTLVYVAELAVQDLAERRARAEHGVFV